MILVDKLTKRFGSALVLDSIELSLPAGKTHVLLGSSGCGKSTLLRILLGLEPSDSGDVQLGELKVSPQTQWEVAQQTGYVVQEGGLFPHYSAFENVALGARIRQWPSDKVEARVNELAQLVSLRGGLLQKFPKQLSGGERQRVALMRALMLNPDILFMDEPLGALDPIIRSELQRELKEIFNRLGKTVLIVTHDLGEAAYFGHTITLLEKGKIAQHGNFKTLLTQPASEYVSTFINAQRSLPDLEA